MFLLMADSFLGGYGFGNQPSYSSYLEPNQEQRVQVQQNNTAFTQNFSDTLWHRAWPQLVCLALGGWGTRCYSFRNE